MCKEHYLNYYDHIRQENHREKIDAAIYNEEIKKLCDFYKPCWEGCHVKADQIMSDILKENEELIRNHNNKSTLDDEDEAEPEDDEDAAQMEDEEELEANDEIEMDEEIGEEV